MPINKYGKKKSYAKKGGKKKSKKMKLCLLLNEINIIIHLVVKK